MFGLYHLLWKETMGVSLVFFFFFYFVPTHFLSSCGRRFEADYLDVDTNPNRSKYQEICQKLFSTYGDTQVMFADYATKVNSKQKGDRRGIVVTEKNIYKHNPKNFAIKKFETPLIHVRSVWYMFFFD